ncbi:MAG: hypothetical protein WDN26_18670 [Chitinophagaceae bacterium]
MTDTPQHIKDIHLDLWLSKSPGERLYQAVNDIQAMRDVLRDAKMKLGLPLGDLDPVGQYLQKKEANLRQQKEKDKNK